MNPGVPRQPLKARLPLGPHVSGITWVTPDLPLYGNDHERSDFAP